MGTVLGAQPTHMESVAPPGMSFSKQRSSCSASLCASSCSRSVTWSTPHLVQGILCFCVALEQGQSLAKRLLRALEIVLRLECETQVAVGVRVSRFELGVGAEMVLRLLVVAAHRVQEPAESAVRVHVTWVDLDRL